MSSEVPNELRYAKSHEWVRVEGNEVVIGISDHAQAELTELVFVELPEVGREVEAGDACAVVESVKTASDIYAPVGGKVTGSNETLVENPGLINESPYGDGWLFRIELSDASQVEGLLTAEQYAAQIGG